MRGLLLAAGFLSSLAACAPAAADVVADDFQIAVPEIADVEVGATASVSLTIFAKSGHTISKDGPLIIDVTARDGDKLELPKRRYRRSDAADVRAAAPRFDIKMRAPEAGDLQLVIDARFWVCRRRTCRPVREKITVTVRAAPKQPPPDAGSG